jgi:hypothetical protein
MVARALTEGVLTMKTEVNTDVAQLTDDQIDAVGGGIILGGPGPCKFGRPPVVSAADRYEAWFRAKYGYNR